MANLTAPSWSDVQRCHADAAIGDTITVNPGTYDVFEQTTLTKYVKLMAGGPVHLIDKTCNGNNSSVSLLHITESPDWNTLVQGPFLIDPGSGYHVDVVGVITVERHANGRPVLLTGVTYGDVVNAQGGNFLYWRSNRGVVWNCRATGDVTFGSNCFNNASFLRHKVSSLGIAGWKTPPKYGMDDLNGDENLYVEDCVLNRMLEGVDCDDNGRTVIRHSSIINSGIIAHGVDTSGIMGARYLVIHHNTFVRDLTPQGGACGQFVNLGGGFIYVRGGTALIHDNVIPAVSDGTWGKKSEVTFNYENLRRNAGGYPCWNTTTAPNAGHPAPHLPGWGYSVGGTNPGGLGSDVLQDLEPIYIWNNSGGGNYDTPGIHDYNPNECGPDAQSSSTYIQRDREYYLSTPKPGYTPYTYPHPLTGGASVPPIEPPPIEPPVEPPVEPPPTEPPVEPPPVVEPPTEPIPPPTTSHPGKKKGHKKNSG